MAGLLDLLNSDLGKTIISGVASQSGQSEEKTGGLLSMALPVLTQAMQRNAQTPEGAAGLMSALSGKHDGGILDNLGDLFNGGVSEEVTNDGAGILGHILGSKQQNVQNALSKQSGIDAGSVGNILKTAAPLLMGLIGKQAKQNNVSGSSGVAGLLGGLLGGNSGGSQNILTSILDADGDGNIVDDVLGMVTGGDKKGGLGGLLGGLFGGK